MSLGTILPLIMFLASYLVHLTLVGAPLARAGYRFGIWLSTFGQDPPRREKRDSPKKAAPEGKPLAERIRPYSPASYVERRERPVPLPLRVIWYVLAGWWLGGIWVVISWSVFLAPYPFPAAVRALLDELPSVMTLGTRDRGASLAAGDAPGKEERDDRDQRENREGGA